MKLLRLAYRNFKGQSFEIVPNGNDATVFGDNAAGKTTMADAESWLRTGKDSMGRSPGRKGFHVKDTRLTGEALNGVDHEVEGTYLIEGGKTVTLKKVYKEVWTKKRGSATADQSGNTTDHYWNEVGLPAGQFQAKLDAVAPPQVFLVAGTVDGFNTLLTWEKRRALLMEVCGDVSDAEVIASDPKLAPLAEVLGDHTITEFRKVSADRKAKINEELKQIPARVDEANRSVPNGTPASAPAEPIDELRAKLAQLREERATIAAGGAAAVKLKELRECEAELQQHLNRVASGQGNVIAAKGAEVRQKQTQLRSIESTVCRIEADIESNSQKIARLDSRRQELLDEHKAESDKQFSFEQTETCPSCGQALPAEKLAAARAEAEAQFNLKKSTVLERILGEGGALRPQRAGLVGQNEQHLAELEKAKADAEAVRAELVPLESALTEAEDATADPLGDPDYIATADRKRILEQEVKKLNADVVGSLDSKDAEIHGAQESLTAAEAAKAQAGLRDSADRRIAELKARESELAAQYEAIEADVFLTEQFVRAKVSMLTEKINGFFQVARFQLFETQENGALVECCETLVDGVPYSGNLNHAARVNVGIDIANTLARHYGFAPPLFVDQCESVTSVMPSEGQQIRLVVSAADKTLRVEVSEPNTQDLKPNTGEARKAGA